ncbi:MAG: hypothetical protein V4555_08655, partial [Acidobacteriota bacterium]
ISTSIVIGWEEQVGQVFCTEIDSVDGGFGGSWGVGALDRILERGRWAGLAVEICGGPKY